MATYYFSSAGNDTTGTGTELKPWKSITKANGLSLSAGDFVKFRCGDTFVGTLMPKGSGTSSSPITYTSYVGTSGVTTKPVITSLKSITTWTRLGTTGTNANLYESANAIAPSGSLPYLNLVVINGAVAHKGTYPNRDAANGGYLKITSHVGKSSITDSTLPSTVSVPTGAEIVIRTKRWVIDRCKVTGRSGTTINYTGATYEPTNGWGYFLQNAKTYCNQNGEWYYNPSTRKITVFSNTGSPPTGVKVATFNNILNTGGRPYIKVNNLRLEGGNTDTVMVSSSVGVTIQNSDIYFSGDHGITTNSVGGNLTITNCVVRWSLNIGIETNVNDVEISDFQVLDTSPLAGHTGIGDSSRGTGIAGRHIDRNWTVRDGEIRRSGNCAISFKNDDDALECNDILLDNLTIDSSNLLKDDQGAIYTHVGTTDHVQYSNRVIQNCTVTNTLGNYYGTDKLTKSGFAFYGDIGSTDIDLLNNTFTGSGRAGILMNYGAQRWTVTGNIVSNNGDGMGADTRGCQLYVQESDTRRVVDNVITGNTFTAINGRKLVYTDNSFGAEQPNMGTMDNNLFVCLATKPKQFTVRTEAGTTNLDLTGWQGKGFDENSSITLQ